MTVAQTADIRSLPLSALQLSHTPAQLERRAHFDKKKLGELADSIKTDGVLQPIVVRPNGSDGAYEVVAGERRVLASKLAGLEEILASVRNLDDRQVARIQLIENLQREDAHPLAEAEGYDELMKKHGYTTEQIGDEIGKSKAYVYGRLKLLALDPASRQAFYRGDLNASTALLIARIHPASTQRKACADITKPDYRGEPMSYREAAAHIHDEYMLSLADAPFPTDDEKLLKNIVACGRCPKNTNAQPELFGDVKATSVGVCTDATCFKAKREAFAVRQIAQAKEKGQQVIKGKDALAIAPHGHVSGNFVNLDDRCYDDPKNRTYRTLIGKEITPALLSIPKSGDLVEVVERKAIAKILKEKGAVRAPLRSSGGGTSVNQAEKAKRAREENFRIRILREIRTKAPKELAREDFENIVLAMFDMGYGEDEEIFKQLEWPEPAGKDWKRFTKAVPIQLKTLSQTELNGVILSLLLRDQIGNQAFTQKSKALLEVAKRLKIDPDKIRKELAAEEKAKAPVKAAKKKSGKKAS